MMRGSSLIVSMLTLVHGLLGTRHHSKNIMPVNSLNLNYGSIRWGNYTSPILQMKTLRGGDVKSGGSSESYPMRNIWTQVA